MKTKEELSSIKAELETVNKKLAELNEEELTAVTGGNLYYFRPSLTAYKDLDNLPDNLNTTLNRR